MPGKLEKGEVKSSKLSRSTDLKGVKTEVDSLVSEVKGIKSLPGKSEEREVKSAKLSESVEYEGEDWVNSAIGVKTEVDLSMSEVKTKEEECHQSESL